MLLLEIFDAPYKLFRRVDMGIPSIYEFTTSDNRKGRIVFNLVSYKTDTWHLDFEVEFTTRTGHKVLTYLPTGEGDEYKIMATVMEAIKQFVEEVKPNEVFFSSLKSSRDSNSRASLYSSMIKKFASSLGYVLRSKHDTKDETKYVLKKADDTNAN